MPQPMLPAEQIERARNTIGKIEKHELSDEQISAIAGAGHNTLVLAGAGTGKTTTIVGYITWLLSTGTATPEENCLVEPLLGGSIMTTSTLCFSFASFFINPVASSHTN